MVRLTRSAVGYALLFALPPGVGAGVFVSRLESGSFGLGVAFGCFLSCVIFLVVLYAASTGAPDPKRDRRDHR